MSAEAAANAERLLVFEVGGAVYALPIADVLEVGERTPPAGIPTLPRRIATIANHHGDALPVVSRGALFEERPEGFSEPSHVLVIDGGSGESERLGLPVDRVIGIVAEGPAAKGATGIVVERREIGGRVVGILDAKGIFEAARRAIGRACPQGATVPGREG